MKLSSIDLRPEHLSLVQRILRAHAPDCDVWVFGSRAQGTAKPMSDLDLAIICANTSKPNTLEDLREAFDESTLSIKVDLVDWSLTDESFRNIIQQQKVVLQKSLTSSDH